MSSSIDKAVREDAYRLLIERRATIYSKVAALMIDIEGALEADDWERARYHLEDLRRALRTSLAFLTDEVYEELECIEAVCGLSGGQLSHEAPRQSSELIDHLAMLHVKLSRSLKVPDFQDLEDIIGLDMRLKRKLKRSRKDLAHKKEERAVEEQAWDLEAQAREFIANKQPKKAVKSLQKAIQLDPHKAVFRNDLGYVYGVLGLLEKSAAEYREAVRLNEDHPERRTEEWATSYFNLGIALRKLANRSYNDQQDEKALVYSREAVRFFEKYLQVMPTGAKVSFTRSAIVALSDIADEIEERLMPDETQQNVA